jgi:single-strand DNA-binding protein
MVLLIGHLTRPPVVKYTSNGSMVCTFSIATNRSFKKADGTLDEAVEYHDIEAWGKLAEICSQLLSTGSYVHLTGELRTQKWTDPTGNNRSKTIIRISSMISLSSGSNSPKKAGDGTSSPQSSDGSEEPEVIEEIIEEEMPF